MNKSQFERTIGLLGEKSFDLIQKKTIAVVGLGGVGGTALEALARSGFCHFVIIDGDIVDASNLNRQILYTQKDIGKDKVISAKEKLLSINPDIEINEIKMRITPQNCHILDEFPIDFIVDAIDDVAGKVALSCYAVAHNLPIIVSLGMANRYDPSQVKIMRLDKTTNDPLAKKFRHEIKNVGCPTDKIMAVVSSETPVVDNGKLHSMMMVPSSAGLNIAYFVTNYFAKK